jgi:filamentous hemagglutinin family protein
MWFAKFSPIFLYTVTLISFCSTAAIAQTIPDSSLGSDSSTVNEAVTIGDRLVDLIEGGATRGNNLFHSFSEFGVEDGGAVYFASPDGIANILTRVTGNNPSEIFGTLGVDGAANLFLLNPNGIVFGENAALDLNGSFLATTADSYIFENGFEYSASNPNSPPLLTINLPVGLQFGHQAEAIAVKGAGHNISLDPETFESTWDTRAKGLEVNSENTLALVGGEINLEGGNLTASQGRIELAGIAETGNVSLTATNNGFSIDSQENTNFQDINLTESASIDTSGNGSGNLQLQGKNISLFNGSAVITRILGDDNGRAVKITASDSISIIGTNADSFYSSINNQVGFGATGNAGNLWITTPNIELSEGDILTDTLGTGNAGNLRLDADSLRITNGSIIASGTYGAGTGGNLSIFVNDVEVLGGSSDNPSGLRTDTFATGKGGNLIINTDNLQIRDGSQIGAGTWSDGDSGNVIIRAINNVEVAGFVFVNDSPFSSGIYAPVGTHEATGQGGNITIDAQELIVSNGGIINSFTLGQGNAGTININVQQLKMDGDFAQISAETFGDGNGGDLIVNATESIEINGLAFLPSSEVEGQFELSTNGLFTRVGNQSMGSGGNIVIETGNLSLGAGGTITANTLGEGNAGSISIRANNLEVRDAVTDSSGSRSGISSAVEQGAVGNGGDIEIVASNLGLIDGGAITVDALGQGNAGNIKINSQQIKVAGVSSAEPIHGVEQSSLPARISAFADGDFAAGLITISTDSLKIADQGEITVSNLGQGNSGNLHITAQDLFLDNSGKLQAEVNGGGQGNINLATKNIFLDNQSIISAQAQGASTGGNIKINNTDNLVLAQNSRILANAIQGQGGNIEIMTQGYFVSADSLVSASSEFGLDGNVNVEMINGDRPLELDQLPTTLIDRTQQIAKACGVGTNQFAIAGRGGLPENPLQNLRGQTVWQDLRLTAIDPNNSSNSEIKADIPAKPILEAQAWKINDQGQIELIVTNALARRLDNSGGCQ